MDYNAGQLTLLKYFLITILSCCSFHYPGTVTTPDCQKTKKTLWSSEDYSTYNDNVGAGCWARVSESYLEVGFDTFWGFVADIC